MSYRYAVVWFRKAKCHFADEPRPLEPYVAVFHSIARAKKFAQERVNFNGGKALIYEYKTQITTARY
jgi:hypothetical protein